MPSTPPETKFYNDPKNYGLWEEVSRLLQRWTDNDVTPQRIERFVTVFNDALTMLNDSRKDN